MRKTVDTRPLFLLRRKRALRALYKGLGTTRLVQVYTGNELGSVSDVGLCTKVVLDLMSGLERFHNEIYTDKANDNDIHVSAPPPTSLFATASFLSL